MENKKLTDRELEQVSGGDVTSANIAGHGKNGKPTSVLWDEASEGLINENLGAEKQEPGGKNR